MTIIVGFVAEKRNHFIKQKISIKEIVHKKNLDLFQTCESFISSSEHE